MSANNCQSKATLQSLAILSMQNHLNFSALQFMETAYMQTSFLCPLWEDVWEWIHTIIVHQSQSQQIFSVIIAVGRLIANMLLNGVQLDSMHTIRLWVNKCDPFVSNLGIGVYLNRWNYPWIVHHTWSFFLYACISVLCTIFSHSFMNCNIVLKNILQTQLG